MSETNDKAPREIQTAQAAGMVGSHMVAGISASLAFAGLFAGLWRSVKDDDYDTTALDRVVAQWMHTHQRPGLTTLGAWLARAGSPPVMVGVGVTGALTGLLVRRLRGAAWTFPIAILGAGVIIQGVKTIFRRPRPTFFKPLLHETGYSFPSGHSLIAVTVYGLLGYFAHTAVRGRVSRTTLAAGTSAFIGMIGLSRVYVGVHYVTDVLAGWSAGFPWLLTCIGLHEVLSRRFDAGTPVLAASPKNPLETLLLGEKPTDA